MSKQHCAVLYGGPSQEREVSLISGKACGAALERKGYKTSYIDVDRNIMSTLTELQPDVCFNALHGAWGEDGNLQGVLNILGIPYTHSGVLASSIGLNKYMTKIALSHTTIRFPKHEYVNQARFSALRLNQPVIMKPNNSGSSVGIHLFKEGIIGEITWPYGAHDHALIEDYIPGLELVVGIYRGKALNVTLLETTRQFFDYTAKYTDGITHHVLPAPIPEEVATLAKSWAEQAYHALGCRGISRCDFRYNPDVPAKDGLYMLEINTHPGMTSLSTLPEQAAFMGIPFDDLIENLVLLAQCDE